MNEQLSLSHVKTGILKQPRRTLIYGVQGIGKSLFCASAPDVIFISTEDGLGDIDCAQFPLAKSFADVKNAIRVLCKEDHKYKALAVDSMDWLERLIWDHVIDNYEGNGSPKYIEDIGYQGGYKTAVRYWQEFIKGLDWLRNHKGMQILLTAHSQVKTYDAPSGDSYDRYRPRLHKLAEAVLCEWVDEIFFANYKVHTKTVGEGLGERSVGIGSGERVILTTEKPSHIAKNRLRMPDEIPLEWSAYEKFLGNSAEEKTTTGE